MGIFDLIQWSWVPSQHSTPMLWACLSFFNKTTNNFHFPCGMFGSTLFDLVAIACLVLTPNLIDSSYLPFKQSSLSWISCHIIGLSKTISKNWLLRLWLLNMLPFMVLAFVFYTKSLQVQKIFLPLATLIHEEYEFSFSKLLLSHSMPLLLILSILFKIRMMLPMLGFWSSLDSLIVA